MFLHRLNDAEKKAFIELAHLIANANGIMDEMEREMIHVYGREMGMEIQIEDLKSRSMNDIVTTFESDASRKVSFIEAIAIAFADGVYDADEMRLIDEMREAYGFTKEYYEEVKAWLKSFNQVYVRGLELAN